VRPVATAVRSSVTAFVCTSIKRSAIGRSLLSDVEFWLWHELSCSSGHSECGWSGTRCRRTNDSHWVQMAIVALASRSPSSVVSLRRPYPYSMIAVTSGEAEPQHRCASHGWTFRADALSTIKWRGAHRMEAARSVSAGVTRSNEPGCPVEEQLHIIGLISLRTQRSACRGNMLNVAIVQC
jgi:hypothetical protein